MDKRLKVVTTDYNCLGCLTRERTRRDKMETFCESANQSLDYKSTEPNFGENQS
jgi:hypothetical protein